MSEAPSTSEREDALEVALLRARDWLRLFGIAASDLSFIDTALGYAIEDVDHSNSFDSSSFGV
jgi:hypothetical protein